jgi:hypothetical protein
MMQQSMFSAALRESLGEADVRRKGQPVILSVFARISKLTGQRRHKLYRLHGGKSVELYQATAMAWSTHA